MPSQDLHGLALKLSSFVRQDSDDELTAYLNRLRENDAEAVSRFLSEVQEWTDQALKWLLVGLTDELFKRERWTALADNPQDFHNELEPLLRDVRACMKKRYGIRTGRPTVQTERNRQIYQLKSDHREWSYGRLAQEFNRRHPGGNLNANSAERAYKAHEKSLTQDAERVARLVEQHLAAQQGSDEFDLGDGWRAVPQREDFLRLIR